MKVLVVDDTPHNLGLLARVLRSTGYTVFEATDGPQALEVARLQRPDLILLDIGMPEMDGYEVCGHLKADDALHDIPIIFISALSDTDGIVRALKLGGVDYVTKPFNVAEVLARVDSHLTLVRQRREIEALRERDRQHYQALEKIKDEFFQMATHDLKNPLNVIMGYIEVLAELRVDPQDQPLLHEGIEALRKAVQKMNHLIAEMLDLAKIGTGAAIVPEPVALEALVLLSLRGYELAARQKRLTLRFTPPDPDPLLCLDRRAFGRVIDNLLSNAIKYTPEGGSIAVSIAVEGDQVVLRVADTGLGIPEGDLERIFDAYYRVDRAEHRQIEGTGMGLSTVKAIVEQHHGTVRVQSALGQGSTFSVYLPRLADSG